MKQYHRQDHKQNIIELRELINNNKNSGQCEKVVIEIPNGKYVNYIYYSNVGERIADLFID